MGVKLAKPAEGSQVEQMNLPIYPTQVEIKIIHRKTCSGLNEARSACSIISHVFPNARIILISKGGHKNMVIQHKGTTVFDRCKGDGYLNHKNAAYFINNLKKAIKETQINNWRCQYTLSELDSEN